MKELIEDYTIDEEAEFFRCHNILEGIFWFWGSFLEWIDLLRYSEDDESVFYGYLESITENFYDCLSTEFKYELYQHEWGIETEKNG